jgi:hypothetical protein
MVEFVPVPPFSSGARTANSETYDAVRDALAARPGEYGKFTTVDTETDLKRWCAAMRYRNVTVSQRKLPDGTWALWGVYDYKPQVEDPDVEFVQVETRDIVNG